MHITIFKSKMRCDAEFESRNPGQLLKKSKWVRRGADIIGLVCKMHM